MCISSIDRATQRVCRKAQVTEMQNAERTPGVIGWLAVGNIKGIIAKFIGISLEYNWNINSRESW
jgi:hypothetical protein